MKTLILVDGHSLAYRMHFALERTGMKTKEGQPTWAVYGFLNALFAMLHQTKPDAIAVSFDVGAETFRNELYPAYKAHREKMPDDLRCQLDWIREGVEKLGIPIYELPGYEADDVIGTIARQAAEADWRVQILTGDQDSFQLVHEGHNGNGSAAGLKGKVEILIPSRTPREGLKVYDTNAVHEKLGVWPDQVIDYKGLRGDTSDNIPGVPGVGEKTAVKFLAEYQTLDALYDHIDDLPANKMREKLVANKDLAYLSKQLATINRHSPIEVNLDACHLVIPDQQALIDYFERCEFRTFVRQAGTVLAPFLAGQGPLAEPETLTLTTTTVDETADARESHPATGATVDVPSLRVPHMVVRDVNTLKTYLETVRKNGLVSIDIETTGLDVFNDQLVGVAMTTVAGLSLGSRATTNPLNLKAYPKDTVCLTVPEKPPAEKEFETVYVPVGHTDAEGTLVPDQIDREVVLAELAPVLHSAAIIKIAHNAKFEGNSFQTYLATENNPIQGLVFDTMIASYVQRPENRHGLKALGFQYFGYLMDEIKTLIGTGKKQIVFSAVPVDEGAAYAACDSHVTLMLAMLFAGSFTADQATLFYELELPLVPVLQAIERRGVALDEPYLKQFSAELEERITVIEKEIMDLAGVPFNLNSPKQVGEVLFDKLGIQPKGKTKSKSAFSTDVKVLESLAEEHAIIPLILDYRQLFKLKSTYIDALPKMINPTTHRVHTSFNQTVAATGRLSSSDPNLQNIPIRSDLGRLIRKAFVPDDRNHSVLLSADYSQIELRLLAHFSEDPPLVDAFCAGEDIHKATASLVFGVPIENVTKEMRYKAKTVNFGVIYGQTAHGLSQQLKVPRAEAAEFIERYFFKYKKVKSFIESVKAEAHQTGFARTLYGRNRDFTEGLKSSVRSVREFSERAAFNTPLQGTAADLMKAAMIRLRDRLLNEGRRSRMILQVHDELVLEVPRDELETVMADVRWAMELEQPLKVPLVVDMESGPTWMESD
ncbi:MAG: DNA polymerase I [Candidatus Melainabacteria bacterium]